MAHIFVVYAGLIVFDFETRLVQTGFYCFSNTSEEDFHSDSSAEFLASSGYVRLQTKKEREIKNIQNEMLHTGIDNFDKNHFEHSSMEGASSSDHEDFMNQQLLLEPTRNDSCSAPSSDGEAESLNNIPWLYRTGDETNISRVATKRNLSVSFSNPFGKRFGTNGIQTFFNRNDDVFRLAPFPRLNWDLLNHAAKGDSTATSNQVGEAGDVENTYQGISIEQNVFANAPWTHVMKFSEEERPGEENIFDGAPLGCLSLIVPLTLSQCYEII